MITEQFAEHFAQAWLTSWNAHNLDAVMSHYADGMLFRSPFVVQLNDDPTGTIRDKEALRTYFSKALEKFPDLHFEHYRTLISVGSVVLYYKSVSNMIAAECMEFNEEGQVINVLAHYAKQEP